MKKSLAILGLGICGTSIAEAIDALPPVREFGYSSKAEAKKEKKRLRELARRKKRLDNMKPSKRK